MEHINPLNNYQVSLGSLDELIATDDPVRFLDAFTEKMDLSKLGFQMKPVRSKGHNIKRTLNSLHSDDLMQTLKKWKPKYRKAWRHLIKQAHFTAIRGLYFCEWKIAA